MYMARFVLNCFPKLRRSHLKASNYASYLSLISVMLFIFLLPLNATEVLHAEEESNSEVVSQAVSEAVSEVVEQSPQKKEGSDGSDQMAESENCFELHYEFDSEYEEWSIEAERVTPDSYSYEYEYGHQFNYEYHYEYNYQQYLPDCPDPLPDPLPLPPLPLEIQPEAPVISDQ